MRIMLINPLSDLARNSNVYFHSVSPLPPLGVAALSAILKKNGNEVIVEDQYASRISNEMLIEKMKQISPQVIGFSCLTTAMSNVERIIRQLRKEMKDVTIILGNIHPTLFPEETLKKGVGDIIIRGEADCSLPEIIEALQTRRNLKDIAGISYVEQGQILHNPDREIIEDLDSLPYPDWHSLNLDHYRRYPMLGIYNKRVLPVQASRGCPFNCLFCSQDKFYKKPRYRCIGKVVEEIEYYYKEFNVECIGFTDAYFPFSKKSGLEFCDELIKRGLHKKIKWFTETRVDQVDDELMRRMKESGLMLVMYGFEVGNEKVLSSIGKKATLAQAREAMRITHKYNVLSLGLFMLGLPEDTRETCLETIKFAKELDPDICKFNIAVPFPGSHFFTQSLNELGAIDSLSDKFTSWYDWSSQDGDIIYSPKKLTKKELLDLQRWGMISFYLRPHIILRTFMKRVFSFTDLFYGGMILFKSFFKKYS